jgi:hypothetical protein
MAFIASCEGCITFKWVLKKRQESIDYSRMQTIYFGRINLNARAVLQSAVSGNVADLKEEAAASWRGTPAQTAHRPPLVLMN